MFLVLHRLQQKHAISMPLSVKLDGHMEQYISLYGDLVLVQTQAVMPEVSMTRRMRFCP